MTPRLIRIANELSRLEKLAAAPSYKEYVEKKKKRGEKPLSKDDWESRILGKGGDEGGKGKITIPKGLKDHPSQDVVDIFSVPGRIDYSIKDTGGELHLDFDVPNNFQQKIKGKLKKGLPDWVPEELEDELNDLAKGKGTLLLSKSEDQFMDPSGEPYMTSRDLKKKTPDELFNSYLKGILDALDQ